MFWSTGGSAPASWGDTVSGMSAWALGEIGDESTIEKLSTFVHDKNAFRSQAARKAITAIRKQLDSAKNVV